MKIKQDFVTNSSSISYIVFVPNTVDIEKLISLRERVDKNLNFDGTPVNIDEVKTMLATIRDSEHYYEYFDMNGEKGLMEWNTYMACYNYAIDILYEANFFIHFDEGGPENEPCVTNIAAITGATNRIMNSVKAWNPEG